MADTAHADEHALHSARPRPSRLIWPWQLALRDWTRVIKNIASEISNDRLSIVAAALAFYAMLALFPGLIALVSLFGLVAEPELVERGVAQLTGILPPGARDLLREQLHALVSAPSTSLSLGLAISVLTALWSASSGVDSLVDAMNVTFNRVEKRSWIKRRVLSFMMTFGLIVFMVFAITLIAVLPSIISWVSSLLEELKLGWLASMLDVLRLVAVGRWPVLALGVAGGLLFLYRYAPCRKRPKRSDISGPILATALFLAVSSLFSLYVSEFAAYHKTYGAVGSVVALLFWFYYSSFVILLGAELSAELEGEKLARRNSQGPPP